MSHLIEKHQHNKGRGRLLFSPELQAEMERRMSPNVLKSDITKESVRRETQSSQHKKRQLAAKQALDKDNKKSNSLKIGQRVTIASRTNPEDVRVERVLSEKPVTILTERQIDPTIDAESFRQLRQQHYENEKLMLDFNEKVVPTTTNFMKFLFPSTWVGAATDKNRSFIGSLVEGNKGLGEINPELEHANLAFDIVAPYAWAKGINFAGKYAPKVMLLYNSPLTGKWTLFGNNMYRLTPRANVGLPGIDKSKIIFGNGVKFSPLIENDLPVLKTLYENLLYTTMTYTPPRGLPRNMKMYIVGEGKQPIPEHMLTPILDKYYPRILSEEEKSLAQQAPALIEEMLMWKNPINFSDDAWFGNRLYSKGSDAVTKLDLDIYHSHIPEYYEIANKMLNQKQLYSSNGKWYGTFSDSVRKVSPEEYIVAHSNAFKNNGWIYDGINRRRAMTSAQYDDLIKDGGLGKTKWTTDNSDQALAFSSEGPRRGGRTVNTIVGNVPKENWQYRPTNYAREARSVEGVEFSPNVEYPLNSGTKGNYVLFGENVPIKSLRGNNGDFSKFRRGLFKVTIPTILGGTLVDNLINY